MSGWIAGIAAQTVTTGDADSELYRRTVAAVIRTVILLAVFVVVCAGSWLM